MRAISNIITVMLASSYLVLGVFSSGTARSLWAPYAALTLAFATLNIYLDRRA